MWWRSASPAPWSIGEAVVSIISWWTWTAVDLLTTLWTIHDVAWWAIESAVPTGEVLLAWAWWALEWTLLLLLWWSLTLLLLLLTRTLLALVVVVGIWALLDLLLRAWSWLRDWTWDALWGVIDVEVFIDHRWDGLDFSAKLLLDVVEVEAILPVDQVDRKTKVPETSGTTNAMQVGLSVLWEIKVDNNIDRLDIDTASK